MVGIGVEEFQGAVQSAITAVSLLGGAMAYMSGYRAARARNEGCNSDGLAHAINVGLTEGFVAGIPVAAFVAILELWI